MMYVCTFVCACPYINAIHPRDGLPWLKRGLSEVLLETREYKDVGIAQYWTYLL